MIGDDCPGRRLPDLGPAPIGADINRIISVERAKSETPFRVLERHFGRMFPHYRGLMNKRASYFTQFVFGNFSFLGS